MKGDDLAVRLETFAVRVLAVVKEPPKTTTGRHVAGQLLRSGTSPGANYQEARGAESRAEIARLNGKLASVEDRLAVLEKRSGTTHASAVPTSSWPFAVLIGAAVGGVPFWMRRRRASRSDKPTST